MAAMNRLAEEQSAYLESRIADTISESILESGFAYFRERRVFVTEVVEGNAIYGAVNGTGVYAVMLDADEFTYSTCTCPGDGYCKHMAAVFFQYSASIGEDAEAALRRMRGGRGSEPGLREAAAGTSQGDPKPGLTDGPVAWKEWFSVRYGTVWQQCRHSLHPLQSVLQELKGTARSWPRHLQRLHWLEAIRFVLDQVERAYSSTDIYNRYYYEMSFTRSVDPWIGNLNELISELDVAAMSDTELEWLSDLNGELRTASLNDNYNLLRWDFMYHVLWEQMGMVPELRASERIELKSLLARPGWGERQQAALLSAAANLDFLEGRDAEAAAAMAKTPFERYSLIVYSFAEQRLQTGRYEAFRIWMTMIGEQLADCRNTAILRPFLKLCREADAAQPQDDSWTKLMAGHLPYSYPELSAHWLVRGKFEEWAELQLFMGVRPDELDVQDLRIAAKSAPDQLIPLYHQAVDESIQARNRQGYRAAVKLMKRLEKLYQSTGKRARWQRFVRHLSVKYSRLRALQEEMKKGKLAP